MAPLPETVLNSTKRCSVSLSSSGMSGGDQHRAIDRASLGELRHCALHGAAGTGNVVLVHNGDLLVIGAGGFGDARPSVHDQASVSGFQGTPNP